MPISQPTPNPTNKLTASVVAVAVIEILRVLFGYFFPGLNAEALWPALAPLAVGLIGYFIKDDANVIVAVPVKQATEETINVPVDS